MAFFYVLLLAPLAIQHFTINGRKTDYRKKNRLALFLFFVLMTMLVALRHESIGTDTIRYVHYFNHFSKLTWQQLIDRYTELGFVGFNRFIYQFTENSQVYFAITAVITTAMIYPTYRRLCVDPSLTILLYVTMPIFVMAFSGIRQMLAVGLGVLAYECIRNKKLIPFILFVGLAMTFHVSAFMLVFMYPLYHTKITKNWLIFLVPVLIVIFIFNAQIFTFLGLLLARFTEYDASITQTSAFTMLFLFSTFAVFAFLVPEEAVLDAETMGLRNFLLLSVILQMFAPLHTIAMRMNYYYIIFIPLLLPKIVEARSVHFDQVAKVGRNVMVVFFLLYFFLDMHMGADALDVFPYRFFWEGV